MNPQALHQLQHPNVPFTASQWSEDQTLHVAVAYSNPIRWRTRRQLANDFRRHMEASANVKLYVGELAYGDRPFEFTTSEHVRDFQWRTRHELWHKENLLNLVIQRFPANWRYGCYIDADVVFSRHDWALETIHLLQHYDWVQMFSHYTNMGYGHEPQGVVPSFANRFCVGDLDYDKLMAAYRGASLSGVSAPGVQAVCATGLAWAFRREAFEACGGLLDTCVVGSGDWHMAFGLAGLPDYHPQTAELTKCGTAYAQSIATWQNRASQVTRRNIGFMNCYVIHHYHGEKDQRGYGWRWKILRDNDFNPHTDIHRDSQGVYQLTPNKPQLRDDIRAYFRSRNEDR